MKQSKIQTFRAILLLFLCALILTGCGTKNNETQKSDSAPKTTQSESASSDNGSTETEASDSSNADGNAGKEKNSRKKGLLDLTKMSSTAIYSEVYNIMIDPDRYKGRMIKIKGVCYITKDDASGKTYYACVIKDATACCSQGIEFKLRKGLSYPEDQSKITVKGTFTTYKEKKMTYSCLKNAVLER
ncbi:hypothetical protein ACQQ9V_06700 [Hornefia butyriciproducens]|uniref:hypothetical protein n=1 Tax=Hornefia butyriciproducens TaxID=2652293 RepID=UPI002A90F49D|nr:hypothetical protein [Hornefia butyriciproducens]MDY5463897.1 hypothetical protein [Hornefia butyriciproducens]